jgi:hypothetical protein
MLFIGHLTISAKKKNYNDSYHVIDMTLRKHIQVYVVKNSNCGSLHFWRYTPSKIGFVASPETSLKQVFQVKNVIASS